MSNTRCWIGLAAIAAGFTISQSVVPWHVGIVGLAAMIGGYLTFVEWR